MFLRPSPGFAFHSPAVRSSDSATGSLPIDVSCSLGRQLRALRRKRNITQLRVADHLGIDQSFLSDVEQGKKYISLAFLQRIALEMEFSLSDLLQDL